MLGVCGFGYRKLYISVVFSSSTMVKCVQMSDDVYKALKEYRDSKGWRSFSYTLEKLLLNKDG